ncbi:DNA binding methylated-DNA--cysteine S-methyltransferase [Tilletiopsis washingtonensis]|uniref:DNA binding methylated-DNA--cysteine S-methyltransferase n=1 Tax=Tilletiopsis washingtonensis TaxID=58919 RepID=A0A316ZEM7_9BASI|nr:DNA binding methylated-DNA--cysteine S-methyltransferase [Tilletiopsis washingtonensis]PWN99999.1 DNA binding methylated-DNA--cysteine S-methyltransferase [Tilletiopsis washingtonensis]
MAHVEAAEFHATVYDICRLIPHGRVTSYGHIARLAGYPAHSRMVGAAMRLLGPSNAVPWQRVLSSSGAISPRGDDGGGARAQAERLRGEGVEVIEPPGISAYRVSLAPAAGYAWFPATLAEARGEAPEEPAAEDEDEDEDEAAPAVKEEHPEPDGAVQVKEEEKDGGQRSGQQRATAGVKREQEEQGGRSGLRRSARRR